MRIEPQAQCGQMHTAADEVEVERRHASTIASHRAQSKWSEYRRSQSLRRGNRPSRDRNFSGKKKGPAGLRIPAGQPGTRKARTTTTTTSEQGLFDDHTKTG
jgi:hypothetical protein